MSKGLFALKFNYFKWLHIDFSLFPQVGKLSLIIKAGLLAAAELVTQ